MASLRPVHLPDGGDHGAHQFGAGQRCGGAELELRAAGRLGHADGECGRPRGTHLQGGSRRSPASEERHSQRPDQGVPLARTLGAATHSAARPTRSPTGAAARHWPSGATVSLDRWWLSGRWPRHGHLFLSDRHSQSPRRRRLEPTPAPRLSQRCGPASTASGPTTLLRAFPGLQSGVVSNPPSAGRGPSPGDMNTNGRSQVEQERTATSQPLVAHADPTVSSRVLPHFVTRKAGPHDQPTQNHRATTPGCW
jgi:hypothetical protein